MKIADGPVTLELNGCRQDRDEERYIRWRDYHKSYPNKQRVVYVHQLSAIAGGADPYKVFSNGRWQVDHTGDALPEEEDGHKVKDLNGYDNLELLDNRDHFMSHNHPEIYEEENERTGNAD